MKWNVTLATATLSSLYTYTSFYRSRIIIVIRYFNNSMIIYEVEPSVFVTQYDRI